MYPVYLEAEPQPIYEQIHQRVVLRRNQANMIQFENIRMVIYGNGTGGNHIQILAQNGQQQQLPQQLPQPQPQSQQQQQQPIPQPQQRIGPNPAAHDQ